MKGAGRRGLSNEYIVMVKTFHTHCAQLQPHQTKIPGSTPVNVAVAMQRLCQFNVSGDLKFEVI